MARSTESADVIVVGAGAAGCVVGRRLADRDLGVLVLEAGPALPDRIPDAWRDGWRLPTVPDWGYASESVGGTDGKKLRRGRVVGGTSWLTRFAVRGSPADFDAWADAGLTGWAFDDALPVFRQVEADAEFGGQPWHGDSGPIPITRYPDLPRSAIHEAAIAAFSAVGIPAVQDHNAPGAIGAGPMPMSSRGGQRVTTADAYLADGHLPGRLDIRTGAPVASVLFEADRAIGTRLADGTSVSSGRVVLAAGTYGSPTILMRSGIGPADDLRELGARVFRDLPGVGSNLADRPGVELDSRLARARNHRRGPAHDRDPAQLVGTCRWTARPHVLGERSGWRRRRAVPGPDPAQARVSRQRPPAIFRSRRCAGHHPARHPDERRPGAGRRGLPTRARARQAGRDPPSQHRCPADRTCDGSRCCASESARTLTRYPTSSARARWDRRRTPAQSSMPTAACTVWTAST